MSNRLIKVSEVKAPPQEGASLLFRTTTTDESIKLPVSGGVDLQVNWGDGSAIEHITTNAPEHVYVTPGDYIVNMIGSASLFSFYSSFVSSSALIKVLNLNCPSMGTTSLNSAFREAPLLESVEGLVTTNVTDMYYLFFYCTSLTYIESINDLDVSSVTNMASMFRNIGFSSFDLTNWDTSSVTDMNQMFYSCDLATTINIGGWNTELVEDMGSMFYGCDILTDIIGLDGLDTGSVDDMHRMFDNSFALESVGDLSSWDTSSVTTMSEMFEDCTSLTTVGNLSGWDVSNVTSMYSMFKDSTLITDTAPSVWWDGSNPQITNHTYCFDENTARPNYAAIPPDWK